MENNETQAIDDLMALIDEEENEMNENEEVEQSEVLENETKEQESETKQSEFESYKAEQESVINALRAELEALKNAKNENKEQSEEQKNREQILKELGLGGIDEKLALIEKFNQEQQERENQAQIINTFNDLEAELKKDYPNADFMALGKLGGSLVGLANGDKEAWKTLARLVNKQGLNRADDNLKGNSSFNANDTFSKLQKGEKTADYEIGKALLALSE